MSSNPDLMKPSEVKRIRLGLGLSLAEMASRLGLRLKSSVCHLESGRDAARGPKLMLLRQLKAELDAKGQQSPATVKN